VCVISGRCNLYIDMYVWPFGLFCFVVFLSCGVQKSQAISNKNNNNKTGRIGRYASGVWRGRWFRRGKRRRTQRWRWAMGEVGGGGGKGHFAGAVVLVCAAHSPSPTCVCVLTQMPVCRCCATELGLSSSCGAAPDSAELGAELGSKAVG
jgi:hypothetical protein